MTVAALFFVTALIYASVGFGGGSTYNALLVLNGVDYKIIPLVALSCNIIVVSGGVWHFAKQGHINTRKILPWVIVSIPAAWIGGSIHIQEVYFLGILSIALFVSGVQMLLPMKDNSSRPALTYSKLAAPIIGGSLGLLAGITGIGGGILLAPVLYLLRWDTPKSIAGTCSLFILVNSLSGLAGQIMKQDLSNTILAIEPYWLLFPAVLIGGQIGSRLGTVKINGTIVKKATALLILYVSIKIGLELF